jgi:predicted dehydrogenase
MGSKFRFVADVQKAREIVDSGILGDIILYENTFAGFCDMSKRWNSQPAISGGGVLIDNGTHSVDILRFLLGNITELQVVEGKRIQNLPVEDTAHLFARTESGAMGNIDLSWSLNKVRADFISLYGSKGTLVSRLERIQIQTGRAERTGQSSAAAMTKSLRLAIRSRISVEPSAALKN